MSEQLYRKVECPYRGCPDCGYNGCPWCFEFEKVERCEHGNIDPHDHWVVGYCGCDCNGELVRCPGAVIGGDDEAV